MQKTIGTRRRNVPRNEHGKEPFLILNYTLIRRLKETELFINIAPLETPLYAHLTLSARRPTCVKSILLTVISDTNASSVSSKYSSAESSS